METTSVAETEADGGPCLGDLEGGLLVAVCILGSSLKEGWRWKPGTETWSPTCQIALGVPLASGLL